MLLRLCCRALGDLVSYFKLTQDRLTVSGALPGCCSLPCAPRPRCMRRRVVRHTALPQRTTAAHQGNAGHRAQHAWHYRCHHRHAVSASSGSQQCLRPPLQALGLEALTGESGPRAQQHLEWLVATCFNTGLNAAGVVGAHALESTHAWWLLAICSNARLHAAGGCWATEER
jgi:hypothetical protein